MDNICDRMKKVHINGSSNGSLNDLCDLFSAINVKNSQQEYTQLCSIIEDLENGRPDFEKIRVTVLTYIKGIDFVTSIRNTYCDKSKFKMINIQRNLFLIKQMFEKEQLDIKLYRICYETFTNILNLIQMDNSEEEGSFFEVG